MLYMSRSIMSTYTTFELSKKYDDLWDQQDVAFHAISEHAVKQDQLRHEVDKLTTNMSELQKWNSYKIKSSLQDSNDKLKLMETKYDEIISMLSKIKNYNAKLESDLYNLKNKKTSSPFWWYFTYCVILLYAVGKFA